MTITWGGIEFDEPTPINAWNPPNVAAVYAIMIQPDPANKPNTFMIIYFGESENLSDRGFVETHHKYQCWREKAGSVSNIFISIYHVSDSEKRKFIEDSLIKLYKPACNDQGV